ncbi:hypothetical protein PVAP13_2NG272203 [Panicum virgatum]|uniref:Uncharacterized protein n=1 Tax=Panicum virgatum TaxID=38727 RepID=A0A8T0VEY5_PANVG|nr:hypothetical protein PVAP13_2NG272203 [Panicum virgatum]
MASMHVDEGNEDVTMDIVLLSLSNADGDTPLFLTMKVGRLEGFKRLIIYVASATNVPKKSKELLIMQNKKRNTLLHEAVMHCRYDIAIELLEGAKKLTLTRETIKTQVRIDIEDDEEGVKLDHVLLLLWNIDKHTPLHLAVEAKDFEMANMLLKCDQVMKQEVISRKYAKVQKNMYVYKKLREAAENGDIVCLIEIMASNPDAVFSVTAGNNTVLHIAAAHGHDRFVQDTLLFMNLDVELIVSQNVDGDTPLHLAVKTGQVELVQHLLRYVTWASGVPANLQEPLIMLNNKGNTLLHEAAIQGTYNMAHTLCEYCTKEGKWTTPKAYVKEFSEYIDHCIQINDALKILVK